MQNSDRNNYIGSNNDQNFLNSKNQNFFNQNNQKLLVPNIQNILDPIIQNFSDINNEELSDSKNRQISDQKCEKILDSSDQNFSDINTQNLLNSEKNLNSEITESSLQTNNTQNHFGTNYNQNLNNLSSDQSLVIEENSQGLSDSSRDQNLVIAENSNNFLNLSANQSLVLENSYNFFNLNINQSLVIAGNNNNLSDSNSNQSSCSSSYSENSSDSSSSKSTSDSNDREYSSHSSDSKSSSNSSESKNLIGSDINQSFINQSLFDSSKIQESLKVYYDKSFPNLSNISLDSCYSQNLFGTREIENLENENKQSFFDLNNNEIYDFSNQREKNNFLEEKKILVEDKVNEWINDNDVLFNGENYNCEINDFLDVVINHDDDSNEEDEMNLIIDENFDFGVIQKDDLRNFYKQEKIVSKRYDKKGNLEYLVKYENLDDDQLVWEKEKKIDSNLIIEFNSKYGDKLLLKKSELETNIDYFDARIDSSSTNREGINLNELVKLSIQSPLTNFFKNLKPERIIGVYCFEQKYYFLIKYQNLARADLIDCKKFKENYPKLVCEFLEKKILFGNLKVQSSSIPKENFLTHLFD